MTPLPYSIAERLLTIEGVGVSYDKPILKGVDAHIDNIVRENIKQGQVVSILGPSGIGKTQLFRCIAGLQDPSEGSIRLYDRIDSVRPGEVGVVAQHYPLLNHRTVLGNLMITARPHAETESDAKRHCFDLLEKFNLADKALSYPQQLSGGQRQRIAIAQQMLSRTHFLLMDEPFSGLDPIAKRRVCETIAEVSLIDELNTMIVITHDIAASLKIADTVWLIGRDRNEQGQVIPGARIKHRYDLAAMGLAWRENIEDIPLYAELLKEIKLKFEDL